MLLKNAQTLEWASTLRKAIEHIGKLDPSGISGRDSKLLLEHLDKLSGALAYATKKLDPTRRPVGLFDPSDPVLMGRFVAMALLAQRREKLSEVKLFYGSGVYAIYYTGDFPEYSNISGSEHPIYVGKADPAIKGARTAHEQGAKLAGRLAEHCKNISKAENLDDNDFACRYLVVASGWQISAEQHLIWLYQPIWNSETKICYGLGKHGDSSETRGNKRSPWDTMHPGRAWAVSTDEDQMPVSEIRKKLRKHFELYPPFTSLESAVDKFFEQMQQKFDDG